MKRKSGEDDEPRAAAALLRQQAAGGNRCRPLPAGSLPPSTTCSRTPVAVAYSAASRANRPGPARPPRPGRRGVPGGVLEHRLDLGDVDHVNVQGPRAGRLGRRAGRSVSPARSAGKPTASSSTARRRPAAAARRSRWPGRSWRPARRCGPRCGWHSLRLPAACPRYRWTRYMPLRGWVLISWSCRYTFSTRCSSARATTRAPTCRHGTEYSAGPPGCGNRRGLSPAPSTAPGTTRREASRHGASCPANTTAGTCRVVPCTRAFAVTSQAVILARASARSRKVSPAKKLPCTGPDAGLDPGLVTGMTDPGRVGGEPPRLGVLQPLAGQPRLTASAFATTGLMLSGTTTRNTPEKNAQASSQPAMTSSSVIENVRYTNMYREKHAVNTSARSLQRHGPHPPGSAPDPRNRPAAHRPAARHQPAWSPCCRPPRTARPRTGATSAPPPPRPAAPARCRSSPPAHRP